MDPFHSLDNLKSQFAAVAICRNSEVCPERSCDRVARCRLDRKVSSLLIGGGRLFSTLLSAMLSIAVLTNEV